ncbi:MAG: Polyphosphate kinase [uncultured Gemmatimonadetes bacterium]|uniref:Polyphosphate kinase n=1 Tax=uncultured Gemmatimonadota bacterium TaxID=203437 RepID=A0A6J4MEF2_9BACT|nr:MAG: Polyphosphate kinase [uncultured Gemmatimonadota bacterium]
MTAPAGVRFTARGRDVLDRIAAEPLPDGLKGGRAERCFFRDIFFDTPEGDLERRGAWVRVRLAEDGTQNMAVEVHDAEAGGVSPLRRALEVGPEVDPRELFAAQTEHGRLLRALVEPDRLVPWMEVETRRQIRPVRRDDQAHGEVFCDAMTVREADLSAELAEVEVRLDPEAKGRKKVLRALEMEYGLDPVTDALPVRARRTLAEEEVDWLEEAVRASRRVAVVALDEGRVALRGDGGMLRLPQGEGTGEDASRRVLRETFHHPAARVRLLGTGPGSVRRPATEVWLAEGVAGPLPVQRGAAVQHLPLGELLAMVGSPGLRDDATLAALHVLARSELPLEADVRRSERGAPHVLRTLGEVEFAAETAEATEMPPGSLLNMELSLLAFNRRVLALAADERVPLMERVRFVSIFGANMDEFFRVRVSGFKRQVSEGSAKRTMDGVTPEQQLDAIGIRARRLAEASYRLLHDELLPALRELGVVIVAPGGLTDEDRDFLREYYEGSVHAVLTPLAAGPGHPFPHIRNLRPAVAAILREPETGTERLGVVELPDGLPRFIPLPGEGRFLPLEELVRGSLDRLYPGVEVEVTSTFRVTRSAELNLHDSSAADLLHAVQEEVRQRRFRPVVRLEVEAEMPARMRDILLRELQYEAPERPSTLGEGDLYALPQPIDLRAVRELAVADAPGVHYPPAPEQTTPIPAERPIFDVLREGEVMVSFPEDSFEATVERFVLEAADDPDVLAIKLALYRTNRKSRLVDAMRRASARGKQVVALVELTARFDEESNIEWARTLRRHGIHVIYGIPGLKVHAKVALVVRREAGGVRRYVYVGTGNLNATTAAAYTDLGVLSADPGLGEDVNELFNILSGAGGLPVFRHLLVAPYNMRRRFLEMIDREVDHALAGRPGWIQAKFNGLADREMIAALYRASQAGVRVDLIVRSLCSLRPGVRGLSENIRVISILGRYLEHARIFRFHNAGDAEYYIGSADWRTRNLSRRVEVIAPVRDPAHRARLDSILEAQLDDPNAWELGPDGTYYQRPDTPLRDEPPAPGGRVPIITES